MVQILSNNSPILKCFILRISGKIIPATVNSRLNPFLTFSFPVRAWANSDNSASLGSRHGQLRKTHCATVPSEAQGKFLKASYKGLYQKRSLCFSLFHFFKDSTLSTWSLETQTDPFIHSHRFVSKVSKFDVNFILWQSIFSKVLSLRLSRRDFTSHFIFPAPLFIFYPGGSCREKVGEIYTGSIPAAYYSERQTKIPINRRQPALYLLFIGISD